ncbi:hypothetical protein Poli38472_006288 [Pythium oligandrum]|uniref:Uncharacterized protein n=1 Tax=Pythium oligandrum TaxID=41045 RepID=A0A8K1FM04_PYTOL|nr:hypothetical protein Poli38472_006288 [Pythium oligandrum]|eukprot:TMW68820.1 hypothetical protein Poli38472_006288 [Pythium oligandrum]
MMLWGVVADDSLLFRLCLYVGVALILFDTVVPMLFRRRVKLVWPRRARPRRLFPRAPVLPREEFRRRKRALEEEIRVLERREERRAKRRSRRREQPRIARRLVDSAMTEPIVPVEERRRTPKQRRVSFHEAEGEELLPRSMRKAPSPVAHERMNSADYPHVAESHSPLSHFEPPAHEERPLPAFRSGFAPTNTFMTERDGAGSSSPLDSRRADPLSVLDNDFPWRLPNYAPLPDPVRQPSPFKMNVRRPTQYNRSTTTSTASLASAPRRSEYDDLFTFRRPATGAVPTAATQSEDTEVHADETHPAADFSREKPSPSPLAKRSHEQAFGILKRRMASPKPPLAQRSSVVSSATTSSQPIRAKSPSPLVSRVAAQPPQPRLKTPKIVRRITFDDDMMAMATPEASPASSKRLREAQDDESQRREFQRDSIDLPETQKRRVSGEFNYSEAEEKEEQSIHDDRRWDTWRNY